MKKKSSSRKQPLTLHGLLGALSFWGTATRAMLFGFLAIAVFIAAISEATSTAAIDNQFMIFIYVLSSFLLLDFGYVMIARVYRLSKSIDILALVVSDVFLALLYIVPKVLVSPSIILKTDPLLYVAFIPIFVLSARILLGFLFGGRKI